ncbi:glutaminase, partial [Rathayibacter sp. AY1B1]|uniref:glutaminase n=1 Tax=Rathayibacter sp. AY1B1 TaxID=2080528 RepID=UPI00215896E1
RVVPASVARDVVAVMATCGVYDGSGRWMRAVGGYGTAGGHVQTRPAPADDAHASPSRPL